MGGYEFKLVLGSLIADKHLTTLTTVHMSACATDHCKVAMENDPNAPFLPLKGQITLNLVPVIETPSHDMLTSNETQGAGLTVSSESPTSAHERKFVSYLISYILRIQIKLFFIWLHLRDNF